MSQVYLGWYCLKGKSSPRTQAEVFSNSNTGDHFNGRAWGLNTGSSACKACVPSPNYGPCHALDKLSEYCWIIKTLLRIKIEISVRTPACITYQDDNLNDIRQGIQVVCTHAYTHTLWPREKQGNCKRPARPHKKLQRYARVGQVIHSVLLKMFASQVHTLGKASRICSLCWLRRVIARTEKILNNPILTKFPCLKEG